MMNNKINTTYTPPVPCDIKVNPIRNADDWNTQRKQCEDDPGKFHGNIAAKTIHWFHPKKKVWLIKNENDQWFGKEPSTGNTINS